MTVFVSKRNKFIIIYWILIIINAKKERAKKKRKEKRKGGESYRWCLIRKIIQKKKRNINEVLHAL